MSRLLRLTQGTILALGSLDLLLMVCSPALQAQGTEPLTGTVADERGAVVAGATVILKNEARGDIRRTISNGDGYFTISAIQPGSYTAMVEAKGFSRWEEKGIVFNASDKRNLSDIAMAVGTLSETVEVTGAAPEITPVDSGEKSPVITTQQLQNVSIVASNPAEFIQFPP